jgi:signal transduction histidine kinase
MNTLKNILLFTLLLFCYSLKISAQNMDSLFNAAADTSILHNDRVLTTSRIVKAFKTDLHFNYFSRLLTLEPMVESCFASEGKLDFYIKIYLNYKATFKIDSCAIYLRKYEDIAVLSKNKRWLATLNFRRASLLGFTERDSAIAEMNKAMNYYISVKDFSLLGCCYISLSALYRTIDLPKASECIYLGMKYLEQSCNIQEESRSHNNLGVIFTDIGLPAKALFHFYKAYALVHGHKNYRIEALYLNNLVTSLLELKKYEDAKIYSDLVFNIINEANHPMYLMYSHINKAKLYLEIKEHEKASEQIKILETLQNENQFGGEVLAKYKLIEARFKLSELNYEGTINSSLLGVAHTTSQMQVLRLKFYDMLYKAYSNKGLMKEAAYYLNKFIETEVFGAQNADAAFILRSDLEYNFKKIDKDFVERELANKKLLSFELQKFNYVSYVFIALFISLLLFTALYWLHKRQTKHLLEKNENIHSINNSLSIANNKLEKSNQDLLNLAKRLSFKLEDPLKSIEQISLDLLNSTEGRLDDTSSEQLNRINSSSKRMNNMIQHIFNLSIIDGSIKFDLISLNELYNLVQESCLELLNSSNGTIVYEHSDEIVFCDKLLVSQVFHNIISNAIKYSKKGMSPFIKIGVSPKSELDFITVYITDNGIGIAEDYFEYIFTPFKKIDNTDEQSFGIGLSTCKRIIEGFGGKIWLQSQINIGTTFFFQLPVSNINSIE